MTAMSGLNTFDAAGAAVPGRRRRAQAPAHGAGAGAGAVAAPAAPPSTAASRISSADKPGVELLLEIVDRGAKRLGVRRRLRRGLRRRPCTADNATSTNAALVSRCDTAYLPRSARTHGSLVIEWLSPRAGRNQR